jgi:hypothetical protein
LNKRFALLTLLSLSSLVISTPANSAILKYKKQSEGQVCKKSEVNKTVKLPNKTILVCSEYGVGYYNTAYKWTIKQKSKSSAKLAQSEVTLGSTTQSAKVTKIYQNILDSFKPSPEYFKMTVITSPKVNMTKVNEIVSYYENSINFFPVPSNKKITWVFLNETEKDWWLQKSSEIDPSPNPDWWDSGKCQISSTSKCAYGNANIQTPIFYSVVGSSSNWETNDQIISDHESVHVYQMVSWSGTHTNCWIIEGQANAIGMAMSSRKMDMNNYRQAQLRDIQRISSNYKSFSVEDWISAYNKINSDRDFCFKNGAGYSMGMLAVESMYDLYEGKIVDQFLIEFSRSKNFDETLRKYFKISESDFYKNVALYAKSSV